MPVGYVIQPFHHFVQHFKRQSQSESAQLLKFLQMFINIWEHR